MQEALAAPDAAAAELSAEQIAYLLDKLAVMANAGTQAGIEHVHAGGLQAAEFEARVRRGAGGRDRLIAPPGPPVA